MTSNLIVEQLKQLPPSPGVYLMKDAEGNTLYVGKAANLHQRVRSYFSAGQKLSRDGRVVLSSIIDSKGSWGLPLCEVTKWFSRCVIEHLAK